MLTGQHLAGQVDGQRALPYLEVQVGHRRVTVQEAGVGQRGVVVQHVEPSEPVDHAADGQDHTFLLGQVDPDGECVATRGNDLGGHPLGPGPVDVEDGDPGTFPGQRMRRGGPDASGTTGDHGHLARHASPARVGHLRTPNRTLRATRRIGLRTWFPREWRATAGRYVRTTGLSEPGRIRTECYRYMVPPSALNTVFRRSTAVAFRTLRGGAGEESDHPITPGRLQ